METKEIFKFFNASGIFDFSALTASPDSNEKNFEQHPQDATYPQLWSPFDDSFTKVGVLLQGSSDVLICGLYRTIPWCRALMGCMTRLTGMRQRVVLPFHQQQHLRISTRLFHENQVYISELYKKKNRSCSRGGEFVMFEAIHKNK